MHDPGPPRTTSVGRAVELAPRDPDPGGRYTWTLRDTPNGSDGDVLEPGETSRDDEPVVRLDPDVPGTYVVSLDAPDRTHRQRVRVFPDERRETEIRVPASDLPVPDDAVDRVSVSWRHNDRLLARDRPDREGDEWVLRTRVPPGRHGVSFLANDDRATAKHHVHEVPGPGRPRLSLDAHVEAAEAGTEQTLVVDADVAVPPGSTTDPTDVDVTFLLDDRDIDPEAAARIEDRAEAHRLTIPLPDLPSGHDGPDGSRGVRIHAVPHAERHGAMATVRAAVGESEDVDASGTPGGQGAHGESTHDTESAVRVTDPHARPEWADSPTIYEVYVRSFAGDTLPTTFAEIERRIPYVESLGIDVLWLTPVLASPTEHGYHITDYTRTADDLGSRAAFESLVETCHDAGIRVVFDLVINHTSRDHPAFQMHAAGVEAYRDHYRRADRAFDVTGTDWAEIGEGDMPEYYFDWERIPNLNFDSPTIRQWLLGVVDDWAEVVDGFRADVAWGIPHGFWKEVADRVPDDVLLLDETLPHDPFYGEGEFHLHYDTSLYETLTGIGAGDESADAVADALDRAEWLGFGDLHAQMRYIENHDENRYRTEYGDAAARAAAAVTFTLPGAPMIYAGQERGNEATRGPFRWHDGDNGLTDFHRRLSTLRDAEPSLRSGAVDFDGAAAAVDVVEGDPDRVTAYERRATETGGRDEPSRTDDDADRLFVVINFAPEPATVSIPDRVTTDLFGSESDDGAGARGLDGTVVVESVAVLR
ncbi:glycosidase [Halorubrum alkaliphilum]|uniref:Glycosidase n=1 Tax=Halorubrum alkaliphilum TaxID=261290 RepID=A0A8T4GLX3_9EURY|nr:alpha-amylase family glycosyl hydrolase [Halorubrum alkaliphilum]MBP1924002.1 glycosidase [Halorubrum alkaliphilum]